MLCAEGASVCVTVIVADILGAIVGFARECGGKGKDRVISEAYRAIVTLKF
jgi:hypothetical protein